jgi:hypothetical protein
LYRVKDEDLKSKRAMGRVVLEAGTYGDFAPALRDWLTHVEQFEDGRSRVHEIEIYYDEKNSAEIRLLYTSPLPEEIVGSASGERGRTCRAWDRLARLAKVHQAKEKVILRFKWEP